jgi:hypothetical protein
MPTVISPFFKGGLQGDLSATHNFHDCWCMSFLVLKRFSGLAKSAIYGEF